MLALGPAISIAMSSDPSDPTLDQYKLFCLIEGDSSPFFVTITGRSPIADLKALVHQQAKNGVLRNVDAKDLILLKASSSERPNRNLAAHVGFRQVDRDVAGFSDSSFVQLSYRAGEPGVSQLQAAQLVSKYWTERFVAHNLNIFVKLPATCKCRFVRFLNN
jgi:hypothetical protein